MSVSSNSNFAESQSAGKIRLPPGPKGRWWPTLQLVRDPRASFERWVRRYGDPFLMHALNGPVVITGRPELIREIFAHDPDQFGLFATQTVRPLLGDGSLLMMEGQTHRRERRWLNPMFHGDRMRLYGETMQQVAWEHAERLVEGETFQAVNLTKAVSLEIIARAIFGGDQPQTIAAMVAAARELAVRSSPLLFFSKKMQFHFLGISPWDRFTKAQRRLNTAFDQELQNAAVAADSRNDILSLLRATPYGDGSQISLEHLRHELSTLLFAGHETSALALAWALYHLHTHPAVLKRLKDSIAKDGDSAENLAKNAYLKAVIQETLRISPIVTEVLRMLKTPLALGPFVIPAGHAVAPAMAIAHYNSKVFPSPERFEPERFLDRTYSPFEYFPFGGGHRRCIGAAFATFEMAVVLGTWIQNLEFELLEKKPVVSRRHTVTMGPSTGIAMRVRKR